MQRNISEKTVFEDKMSLISTGRGGGMGVKFEKITFKKF